MIPSPSSPFQFSNFGTPQQQQNQQQQNQQQQNQQQQQQQQQQFQQMPGLVVGNVPHIQLLSTDRSPLSYQTKWLDIHDDSKNLLLAIEEKMLEYRDESRRLDQCQRLYDAAALHKGFELESVRISQELGSVGAAVVIEQSSLEQMVQAAKILMRNAEVAVRSFIMLRHHFSRLRVPAVTAGSTPSSGVPLAIGFSNTPSGNPPAAPPPVPTADFYSGIPSKPSAFLQQTVSRFESQLSEYGQRIEELERLLQDTNSAGDNGRSNSELSLLQSLPSVMTNVHDFFIHVAAEVESLHQQIEAMRIAFIADRRRRGDEVDPFLEADRREVAKREVAAKRVHPSLHGPMTPLTTHMPGMDINAQAPTPFGAGSVQSTPFSVQSSAPLFGAQGTPSLFSPASAPVQFTPSTVASSTFGSTTFSMFGASTPSLNIFGGNTSTPAGSAPASNLFGAGTATSLFGGSPATPFGTFGQASASQPKQMARAATAATPLFSMAAAPTAATPLFGVAAAPTAQTPLFGTPATGTGAAAVKPKPRGPRRK